MKFNCLRFLSVVFISIACTCSQSVFAEDSTPSDTPSPCDLNQSYNNGACALQNIRYVDDEGLVQNCPGSASNGVSTNHYEFIKDENINSVGIESCALRLKLNKSVCGKGTNVVYVFDMDMYEKTKNDDNPVKQYVLRQGDFRVVDDYQSILPTEYPSAVITVNSYNRLGDTAEQDYCETCKVDNENRYNINGKCMFCHTGYYVHAEDVEYEGTYYSCEICPAGYACPGNDDEGNDEMSEAEKIDVRNIPWNNSKADRGSLLEKDRIACGQDEYAESGRSQCSSCRMGYSTHASGPAKTIAAEGGKIFDGTCKERDSVNGFGIQCTSINACKMIPTQLCYGKACCCTDSETHACRTDGSISGGKKTKYRNVFKERAECGSSYDLGDDKVLGAINTKVVQTRKKSDVE